MKVSQVEVPPPVIPNLDEAEPEIDYDALETEDHKPVDRIFVEKLYRLLTHPLYASWSGPGGGRPFLVLVNVGWFYQRKTPAVVPDCLLSLGVTCPKDLQAKQGHSYYQWDMGKAPDVVIEIVSDRSGGEESHKKDLYAGLGVPHYAVYDPQCLLGTDPLRTYELVGGEYRLADPGPWPKVGLGLRLWQGHFEGHEDTWLRWCNANGELIPTGEERAAQVSEQLRQTEKLLAATQEELQRLKSTSPPEVPGS
jgi:hypothetical protein